MEIIRIMDEFENMVEECSRIPMTGRLIIHEDVLYNFIDRIRAVMPEAVHEAEWILREKERILTDANNEAVNIVESAKIKLERITGESEVVKLSRIQGDEIVEKAKGVAREVTQGAFGYADEIMLQLQSELDKTLQVVKKGREEIRQNFNKNK